MDIWNIDTGQKQKDLAWAELCYFISTSYSLFYPPVSILLLSQNGVTTISTIKFEINNITFAIRDICEGHVNWKIDEIAPSDYAMDICIFNWLCLEQKWFLLKDLVAHNEEKNQHPTTSGWRYIASPMWWLPCNSHWSKWPKTFCGRCIWSTLHLLDINLAALFWHHCSRSMWDCFVPYCRLLQKSRRDITVALIIFSDVGLSRYLLIFPSEYRLKFILLHNLAPRQHVESNITPTCLGGLSLGEIVRSPTLIDISDILLSSSLVVMIRISVLSSFNFNKLWFIHIRISAMLSSIRYMFGFRVRWFECHIDLSFSIWVVY